MKDAGLEVLDLKGNVLQVILPPSRRAMTEQDPPAPGTFPEAGTAPCVDSESGETFGRFNNVAVFKGVSVRRGKHGSRTIDVAAVTDRGCDRLRFYEIDPIRAGGPLFDVTSDDVPRVFPERFEQPSALQTPGATSQVVDNDLDAQSTAYGIALYRPEGEDKLHAFVTQRSRSVMGEFELVPAANGKLSYRAVREYRFDPVFAGRDAKGKRMTWTPCREDAVDDPQFEGLVVDADNGVLYAAQEAVGVWQIPLDGHRRRVVTVPQSLLIERTKTWFAPYWATPDDGEFECEYEAPEELSEETLVADGNAALSGKHLVADVEGLVIAKSRGRRGWLVVSSQGDDSFHLYDRREPSKHLATFTLNGIGETDGHELVTEPLGDAFPNGLFVAQNGKAPGPESEDSINGYDYDNSTQLMFADWGAILDATGER